MASRYVLYACIFSRCWRIQPPTGLCLDAPYTVVFERFRHFIRPSDDHSRKASLIIHISAVMGACTRLTGSRYDYIYHPGIFLWLLGVCLKMMFGQNTSVGTYLGALLVEGWGIGCVFQPGTVHLTHACMYATMVS